MKKLLILSLSLFSLSQLKAQEGLTFLTVKGGMAYQDAMTGTVGLDFTTRYHNAVEISLTYYKADDRAYDNVLCGLFYKPLLIRSRNSVLKFRMGTHIGTDNSEFVISALGGLEFLQSLAPGVDLVLSNNSGYYFFAHNHWRVSGEVGIRFSF